MKSSLLIAAAAMLTLLGAPALARADTGLNFGAMDLIPLGAPADAPFAAQATATPPLELSAPVRCDLGRDCFIQYYVDADPGAETADYACGAQTYDGHEGVDFRVATAARIRAGAPVLAAAPGTVHKVEDGHTDMLYDDERYVPQNLCGNGVQIDHDGGWRTIYCHLKNGSMSVREGDQVTRGQPIGEMGLSGTTTFPHLHFAVRLNGLVIDPFTGRAPHKCGADAARPLWRADSGVRRIPTGLLGAGVTRDNATLEQGRRDPSTFRKALTGDRFIYIWAHLFGMQSGDVLRLRLVEPGGKLAADEAFPQYGAVSENFINIGVEPADADYERWPEGSYIAQIVLERGGAPYFEWIREMYLRDVEQASRQ